MENSNLVLAERYLAPKQRSSERRFKFTEKTLAALPLSKKGQVEYRDDSTQGFVCRVSPTGRTLYV